MRRDLVKRLLPVLGVLLFAAAVWVLYRQLREHRVADIVNALDLIPLAHIGLAVAFTALGYGILTGYDHLAMRYIGHRMRFGRVAMAALVGYSMSNSIGHSFLTGGTVRFRLYSQWGLQPGEIARVIIFSHVTFYLGTLVLIGAACVAEPAPIGLEVRLGDQTVRIIGLAMLAAVGVYFAFIMRRRAPIRLRRWEFPVPGPGLSLAQLVIGSLDMALVAAVLWSLMPPTPNMTFAGFLGLFLMAQLIGVGSQVPGGLGVFEALMLHVMGPEADEPRVLAALLLYRLVYFIIPLALGAGWLGLYELRTRRST